MDFAEWLKAHGFDPNTITADQKKYLQAQFDAEIQAAAEEDEEVDDTLKAGAGDDDEDEEVENPALAIRAAAVAESKRIFGLTKVAAQFKSRVDETKLNEIHAKAIAEEWDNDKLELHLIRAERPQAQARGGGGGGGARAKISAAVITAALSLTAGIDHKAVANTIAAPTASR
jgi:hypothetical protein